jgi:cyanophycinase-like exopeptidase
MTSTAERSRLSRGVLVIMGSGETSPTMVTLHQQLFARYGSRPRAVVIDTPAGFQENVAELTDKAIAYFRESVGMQTEPLNYRAVTDAVADPASYATSMAHLQGADWVFAGPGSPSYALRTWESSAVPEALRGVLSQGGTVVMASAASLTLGAFTIPVYEIYKVGAEPHWLPGLDVVGAATGWTTAVVPHFDNNDGGGTHDTRFCYLGERRLRAMEAQLPEGAVVLGVDEHTAFVYDLDEGQVRIAGRGGVTLRVDGSEQRWESGSTLAFDELDAWVQAAAGAESVGGSDSEPDNAEDTPALTLDPLDPALDLSAALAAVVALDRTAHGDVERAHVRTVLSQLATRSGSSVDVREAVAPFVEAMLDLRKQARDDKRWADADAVRDAVIACGVEVRDTADGVEWTLASP